VFVAVQDLDDVRVDQLSQSCHFVAEAGDQVRLLEGLGLWGLEDDHPPPAQVLREEGIGHAAFAELVQDSPTVVEVFAGPVCGIGYHGVALRPPGPRQGQVYQKFTVMDLLLPSNSISTMPALGGRYNGPGEEWPEKMRSP